MLKGHCQTAMTCALKTARATCPTGRSGASTPRG
ncbi:DUF362 domain-containing protein [Flavonifractor plautii]|nr:DUF362 domain-containing protein [Flavonifractor plautii]